MTYTESESLIDRAIEAINQALRQEADARAKLADAKAVLDGLGTNPALLGAIAYIDQQAADNPNHAGWQALKGRKDIATSEYGAHAARIGSKLAAIDGIA